MARSHQQHPDAIDIFTFVTDVAHNLPETQGRLIELLQAIKDLPPIIREGDVVTDTLGEKYWSDLPGLRFNLMEFFDGS